MTKSFHLISLGGILTLVLSACTLFNNNPTVTGDPIPQPTPLPTPIPVLAMSVTFATVNQTINYSYLVSNVSGVPIPGPVTVSDDRVAVACPEVTTLGNLDTNLDVGEALTCTGIYTITQADLDTGSVTTLSTASASGNYSPTVATTVPVDQTRALTLVKSADPQSFNSAGQTITYNYVITNSGNVDLGPIQFTITDDRIGIAFNCGAGGTILTPGGTVTCSATYITTANDLSAGTVTNSAYATDGTTTSNTVTVTVNKGTVVNPSNLTPGTTVQHVVVKGEWLWQIARCYGADPRQVVQSNSQLAEPARIQPGITVTVPNIGAGGRTIYGPPCVGSHTVQSGETWNSIAQLYNADPLILQDVNPGGLIPGNTIKVPLNSAGNK